MTVTGERLADDQLRAARIGFSIADQAPGAGARTYITGSQLIVPPSLLRVGNVFRWTMTITKTAAGVAASTYDIALGTAGTVADTAVVAFTKPAGSAAADVGKVMIEAVVRSIGATGVMIGTFEMTHNLAATGHAVIPSVVVVTLSGAIDMTRTGLRIGLCVTPGAADALTIRQVITEVR